MSKPDNRIIICRSIDQSSVIQAYLIGSDDVGIPIKLSIVQRHDSSRHPILGGNLARNLFAKRKPQGTQSNHLVCVHRGDDKGSSFGSNFIGGIMENGIIGSA